jgi:hypothetical protein
LRQQSSSCADVCRGVPSCPCYRRVSQPGRPDFVLLLRWRHGTVSAAPEHHQRKRRRRLRLTTRSLSTPPPWPTRLPEPAKRDSRTVTSGIVGSEPGRTDRCRLFGSLGGRMPSQPGVQISTFGWLSASPRGAVGYVPGWFQLMARSQSRTLWWPPGCPARVRSWLLSRLGKRSPNRTPSIGRLQVAA